MSSRSKSPHPRGKVLIRPVGMSTRKSQVVDPNAGQVRGRPKVKIERDTESGKNTQTNSRTEYIPGIASNAAQTATAAVTGTAETPVPLNVALDSNKIQYIRESIIPSLVSKAVQVLVMVISGLPEKEYSMNVPESGFHALLMTLVFWYYGMRDSHTIEQTDWGKRCIDSIGIYLNYDPSLASKDIGELITKYEEAKQRASENQQEMASFIINDKDVRDNYIALCVKLLSSTEYIPKDEYNDDDTLHLEEEFLSLETKIKNIRDDADALQSKRRNTSYAKNIAEFLWRFAINTAMVFTTSNVSTISHASMAMVFIGVLSTIVLKTAPALFKIAASFGSTMFVITGILVKYHDKFFEIPKGGDEFLKFMNENYYNLATINTLFKDKLFTMVFNPITVSFLSLYPILKLIVAMAKISSLGQNHSITSINYFVFGSALCVGLLMENVIYTNTRIVTGIYDFQVGFVIAMVASFGLITTIGGGFKKQISGLIRGGINVNFLLAVGTASNAFFLINTYFDVTKIRIFGTNYRGYTQSVIIGQAIDFTVRAFIIGSSDGIDMVDVNKQPLIIDADDVVNKFGSTTLDKIDISQKNDKKVTFSLSDDYIKYTCTYTSDALPWTTDPNFNGLCDKNPDMRMNVFGNKLLQARMICSKVTTKSYTYIQAENIANVLKKLIGDPVFQASKINVLFIGIVVRLADLAMTKIIQTSSNRIRNSFLGSCLSRLTNSFVDVTKIEYNINPRKLVGHIENVVRKRKIGVELIPYVDEDLFGGLSDKTTREYIYYFSIDNITDNFFSVDNWVFDENLLKGNFLNIMDNAKHHLLTLLDHLKTKDEDYIDLLQTSTIKYTTHINTLISLIDNANKDFPEKSYRELKLVYKLCAELALRVLLLDISYGTISFKIGETFLRSFGIDPLVANYKINDSATTVIFESGIKNNIIRDTVYINISSFKRYSFGYAYNILLNIYWYYLMQEFGSVNPFCIQAGPVSYFTSLSKVIIELPFDKQWIDYPINNFIK